MSALTVIQSAAIQLIGQSPPTVFGSTEQTMVELRTLMNVVSADIAEAYDWPKLTRLATFTGDGVAEQFAPPADYDRMLVKGNIHSTRSQMPLARARDLDQWLEFQITPVVGYPGYWTIIGDDFHILPTLNPAEQAKFYYITKNIWAGDKEAATVDGDTFLLSEKVLTLGLILRYRQNKRLDDAADLHNYQTALSEEIARSKGSRTIAIGAARISDGAEVAYPGMIIP